MKDLRQREFIDLNKLMGRFSLHLDRKLMKTLFAEYKRLLTRAHYQMPDSRFFQEKVRSMQELELSLDTADPGTIKLQLQKSLSAIVAEIETMNQVLNRS